jgi:hypothetical protein
VAWFEEGDGCEQPWRPASHAAHCQQTNISPHPTTRTSRGGVEAHPQRTIGQASKISWTSEGCVKRWRGGVRLFEAKSGELRRGQRRCAVCGCEICLLFGLLFHVSHVSMLGAAQKDICT